MLNKSDKLIHVILYSPHKCEFIYEREDGTRYTYRKLDEEEVYEIYKNPHNPKEWLIGEKIQ